MGSGVAEDDVESCLSEDFSAGLGEGREEFIEVFLEVLERALEWFVGRIGSGATYRNETSLNLRSNEGRVTGQGFQELYISRYANNVVFVQRLPEHPQCLSPIPPMHNDLCNHGVIVHTDLRTLGEPLLNPQRRRESRLSVRLYRECRSQVRS